MIEHFKLIEPPTSGQLRELALTAMGDDENLSITVLSDTQEVPRPVDREFSVDIARAHRIFGRLAILEGTVDGIDGSIRIDIDQDDTQSAHAFLVSVPSNLD